MSIKEPLASRWYILGVMCLALVIASLDSLVITMAIPSLASHFHATQSQLQWSVDSYALAFASTLIFMGVLADRYGRKKAFISGMSIFVLASVMAAFAPSLDILIAARAVMGLGGALIMPATLAILKDIFPPEERPKAMGIWVGVSSLGIPLGPVLGGFLLTEFWWGSVFLINVPVILIAIVGATILIPESRNENHPGLNIPGLLASIVGATLVVDAIIQAPERGWLSPITSALFLGGFLIIMWFLYRDRRSSFPMLGRTAYSDRRFSVPLITIASLFFTVFGSLFILTSHLQNSMDLPPIVAGLHLLPLCAAVFVAPIAPRLVDRFGIAPVSTVGPILAAVSMVILSVAQSPNSLTVLLAMTVLGLGIGFGAPTSVDTILAATPADQAGAGSAVADVAMQGGGALGIAVMGSVVVSSGSAAIWPGFICGVGVSIIGAITVRILLRKNKLTDQQMTMQEIVSEQSTRVLS